MYNPGIPERNARSIETDILVFPTTTTTGWRLLFLELRLGCEVISEKYWLGLSRPISGLQIFWT